MSDALTKIVSTAFYNMVARAVEAHLTDIAGNPVTIICNHMEYDGGPYAFGIMIREQLAGEFKGSRYGLIARTAWKFEFHLFDDAEPAILALMSVLIERGSAFIKALKAGESVGVKGGTVLTGNEQEGITTLSPGAQYIRQEYAPLVTLGEDE